MSHFDEQMAEAVRRQRDHVDASHRIDRTGWTDDQWIADARRLMGDIDGSVMDLVNGHVMALLQRIDELETHNAHLVSGLDAGSTPWERGER